MMPTGGVNMFNRIKAEIISIVSMNLFILLGSFLPIALYKNQYYTIYDFPEDNWYGLVIKAVYIAAIFLILFITVPQTANSYDMVESFVLTFFVFIGFVGTQIAGFIDMGILPAWGFGILLILLSLATYELDLIYRSVHKPVKKQKEEPIVVTTPKEEPVREEISEETFNKLKDMVAKYVASAEEISRQKASNYRLITTMTIAATLVYKLPVVFWGEQRMPLTVLLSKPYVRTGIEMISVLLILSYTILFNVKASLWPTIVMLLTIGTFLYMLYVLGTVVQFNPVTWLIIVLAIFFMKSIHDIITYQ